MTFFDFIPPIYRNTVIETGIYPTLTISDIDAILDGEEPAQ